jgi:hypothetical protein
LLIPNVASLGETLFTTNANFPSRTSSPRVAPTDVAPVVALGAGVVRLAVVELLDVVSVEEHMAANTMTARQSPRNPTTVLKHPLGFFFSCTT